MKKLLIPFALMFVILALLFVYMCLPIGRGDIPAINGQLEIKNNSMYRLNGQWEFCYGELLTPDQVSQHTLDIIDVPSAWSNFGYPEYGVATYRLVLSVKTDRPLMLFMQRMASEYDLWVNGELIQSTIITAPSLYDNTLVPVSAENGFIEIILHVKNFQDLRGGLTCSLMIGDYDTVITGFFRTRLLYCLSLGCILMMAFYHVTLYIFRKRENVYLIFALLCAVCFIRFVFEDSGLNDIFSSVTNDLFLWRFYAVIWVTHSYFIMYFSLSVIESKLLASRFINKHLYWVVSVLPFLLLPLNSVFFTATASILFIVPMLAVIVLVWRSPKRKENPLMLMYAVSLVLFLIVGSASKIISHDYFMPGIITNMFLMMTQMILLSRNYAHAFTMVEETNTNLEGLVAERTRQLAGVNETLLISQNALKEMISNISHDLKTPLTVLGQYLELLDDGSIDLEADERSDYIHVAYNKNLNMQRLIRNLFEATRIETGQTVYNLEWHPLSKLLFDLEDRHGRYLRELGLLFTIDSGADCHISIDRDKIWSVFDNIIYNAARHTPKGGAITVTARHDGGVCTVSISDTGEGIAEEHLPHIFDRFYKVSKARSESGGDSGIGLYIAKTVVEGMGGTIAVQSKIGEGASFSITLDVNNAL